MVNHHDNDIENGLSQGRAHRLEGTQLRMPIAIIGMACRLPGEVSSLESFWDFCHSARNSWSKFPKERCDPSAFRHPNPEKIGCVSGPVLPLESLADNEQFQLSGAHFLKENVASFDTSFFNITEEEAKAIDPRHRLLLECTYEALENGGIPMNSIAGQNVGVYVGTTLSHYEIHCLRDFETAPRLQHMGCADSFLANRISYFYDLKGPSVSVDTACSSGLAALHLACQSLRVGEIKQAIVGGCQLNLMPEVMASVSSSMLYSAEGKCFPFDERVSGGFGPGEGASCVILKPLREAIDAGDNIRAVIRNTGMNQNGRTTGISMPSSDAQVSLMRSVYESVGLDPSGTKYVEAHGTGTTVGDPLEATALAATFAERATPKEPVFIGSAKSNFGHLEGVSGIVSIIKAALMLQKRTILPNANFKTPNPKIPSLGKLMTVPTSPLEWVSNGTRRASVNNLGSGGANVHVILEENSLSRDKLGDIVLCNGFQEQDESWEVLTANIPYREAHCLYILTANDAPTVKLQMQSLRVYLEKWSDRFDKEKMLNLAYTLGQRRSLLPWRIAIVASNLDSLTRKLELLEAPSRRATKPPKLGFVFTGQGANWYAMGRELFQAFPVFYSTITVADKYLARLGASWSLVEELSKDATTSLLQKAHISQPACTAIQLALVKLLDSWGVRPHAVTGHSSGEIAAAFAAGALTLESCLSIAYYRGTVSSKLSERYPEKKGAMLAIGTSYDDATSMIAELKQGRVVVACVNSPFSITASGDAAAVAELQRVVENKKLFCRKLNVDVAYHSHHMETIAEDYRAAIGNIRPTASKNVQFFSSLLGRKISTLALGSSYWVSNLKSPVQFSGSLLSCCSLDRDGSVPEDPVTHLVEIGPHSALRGPIRDILAAGPKTTYKIGYSSTLVRNENAVTSTLNTASELLVKGCHLSMSAINFPKGEYKPRVLPDLSPYPWNHEKAFWHESRITQSLRMKTRPRNDILGTMTADSSNFEPKWRNIIRLDDIPWLRHHKVRTNYVFPFAGYIAMTAEAINQQADVQNIFFSKIDIRDVSVHQPLVIFEGVDVEMNLDLKPVSENSQNVSDSWNEFIISSWTNGGDCVKHCCGRIRVFDEGKFNEIEGRRPSDLTRSVFLDQVGMIESACVSPVVIKKIYQAINSKGLEYGPCMTMLSDCYVGDDNAVGRVQVPDTASLMPHQFETDFIVHPAFFESCLQIVWPLLGAGHSDIDALYRPSSIKNLIIRPGIKNQLGDRARVLGTASSASLPTERIIKSIVVLADDADQQPAITIDSLVLTKDVDQLSIISNNSSVVPPLSDAESVEGKIATSKYFKVLWEPCLDFLQPQEFQDCFRLESAPDDEIQGIELLERASLLYFRDALKDVTDAHYNSLQVHHQKFYRSMQKQLKLAKGGDNTLLEARWDVLSGYEYKKLQEILSSQGVAGTFLKKIGENISRIMLKDVDVLSLMLEDGLLEEFYKCSPPFVRSNRQAASLVKILAHENSNMKILEIGAGTGGVTLPILEALGKVSGEVPRFRDYIFTDISSGFFESAQNKLKSWASFVTFRKLNIEDDPADQGYEPETFDLVIAANVLHATTQMNRTMQNVRKLLKPGGKLLLVEITAPKAQFFPFGLVPGWWLGEEEYRTDGPLLAEQQWGRILKQAGFSGIDHSLHDYPEEVVHSHSVILSTAKDLERFPGASKDLLIIHSHESTRFSLDVLVESLRTVTGQVPKITSLGEISDLDLSDSHCIFLDELVKPMLADISATNFRAIQNLCTAQIILWTVQGGQLESSTPEASMAIGLARSIRSEKPNVRLITVDFDEKQKLSASRISELIANIYRASTKTDHSPGMKLPEMEYLERNGYLCIPRVVQDPIVGQCIQKVMHKSVPEYQTYQEDSRAMTLKIQTPGSLDSFYFADANDDGVIGLLKSDDIEIQVKASALNFRDSMATLGKIPFGSIGSDCAGIITAVGSKVSDLSVGDRVCGLMTGGAFSTRLRHAAFTFVKMPENLGFDESASLPTAFTTAYHSIVNVARLCRGESILIHAAAGGVGQAAIMLAKLVGAEIYVTVGSIRKKDLITSRYNICEDHIFYSRDASFEDGIMHITGHKGIDVALNTLSGEALLATWRCLTPFGRFVELGRRDFQANNRLEMEQFIQNRTYAGVDLQALIREKPSLVKEILHNVFGLHSKGDLKPAYPLTVFPYSKIETAFLTVQSGESMGKIILIPEFKDRFKVMPRMTKLSALRSDASYLITGGSGGIASVFTKWLASQGATHIILASRSGRANQRASRIVDELRVWGSNVTIYKCDVTDKQQVKELVENTSRSMPPIRGVIHGAFDYRSSLFENSTAENHMAVIRPKVHGAWNLHNALADHDLDFFVSLASITGHIGTPGLSAYGATTAFLDAFSSYRASLGLAASTIDLGPVTGVGILTNQSPELQNQIHAESGTIIGEKELLAIMDAAVGGHIGKESNYQSIAGIVWTGNEAQAYWSNVPRFSQMRFMKEVRQNNSGPTKTALSVRQKMCEALSLTDARTLVYDCLAAKFATTLMIDEEDLSPNKPLGVYGTYSLVAVELRNWIIREMDATVILVDLLADNTLATLTEKILQKSKLCERLRLQDGEAGADHADG